MRRTTPLKHQATLPRLFWVATLALILPVLGEAPATISLTIAEPGQVSATGPEFDIAPNSQISLQLTYVGRNLGRSMSREVAKSGGSTWLKITVIWLDAEGNDVDVAREKLAFPPLKQSWEVADGSGRPVEVAVNLSSPGDAAKARVDFTVLRDRAMAPGGADIGDIRITPGQVQESGIARIVTGPPDAGPVTSPPEGVSFGENLAPNSTLEEGEQTPLGWRIVGDNSGGAARWIDGGAYSGRRAFRIDDRAPYRRSWGEEPDPQVLIPGSEPQANYGFGREEVYARWVSDPVPAEPNALYMTMAAYHYGNRHDPSRNLMNPVRIEFLDANQRLIPLPHWANSLPDAMEILHPPGWTPIVGKPVPAPRNAAFVRLAIVLQHAYYETMQGPLNKNALNPGFVVVDNIALFKTATERPADDPGLTRVTRERAFAETLAAGGVPFVPSSPAHRPNSLTAESHSPIGGGILLSGQSDDLGLIVRDKIGDRRHLNVAYDLLDATGQSVHREEAVGTIEPYREAVLALDVPADLPLGPYTIAYILREGDVTAHAGESRLAVAIDHPADLAERRRMDYPFATWAHRFKEFFVNDHPEEFALLGESCRYMGAGKQGFVVSFYPEHYLAIANDTARRAKIEADIAERRALMVAMAEHDVFNLPLLHPVPPLTDETRPRAVELVTMLVNGLADLSLVWTYGDEQIHGGIEVAQLDETTRADGSIIMNWGYPGSARTYIHDYLLLYDTMKSAQPDAIFGFNSASHGNGNVMRLLLAAGARGKFDMLGVNMFMSPFSIWPATLEVMREHGMDDDAIHFFGHNLGGIIRTDPRLTGSQRLEGELHDALSLPKQWTQILHSFPQLTFVPQWDPGLGNDQASFTFNQRVKPAFSSYAAMTRLLGAGRFTAKHLFPGAELYVRERSARPGIVGIAWANSDNPVTIELAVGADTVTVADVWGNTRDMQSDDGVLELTVTDWPHYIVGATKLEPAPSVRITLDQASTAAGKPQFAITVNNDTAHAIGGHLTLDPRTAATVAPQRLAVEPIPPGQTRRYTVTLAILEPTMDQPVPLHVRFATDYRNRVYETTTMLNFHFAPRVQTPPIIDGELDDWRLEATLALVADREEQLFRYENKGPWAGPEELSGKLWLTWDNQHLYFAAKVRDGGQTIADTPEWLWAGDSIEMLIAPMGSRERDSAYAQIALGLVKGGQSSVMRYHGPGPNGPLLAAKVAVKRVDGGYLYEAAVPWRDLTDNPAFKPRAGHPITTAFGFNDKDAGVRMISWYDRVTYKDPARFGQIVLTAPVDDTPFPPPPGNLVPNGDFEDAALPPADDLSDWSTTFRPDPLGNPSAIAYVSTDGAYQGKSLVIERLHVHNHAEVHAFRVPVQSGRRYLVRAMIKAPMRQPAVHLSFRNAAQEAIQDPLTVITLTPATDFNYNSLMLMNTDRVTDRARFHPAAIAVDAPSGATTLWLSFSYNWASGKAHFDNIEVIELPLP